MGLDGLVLQNLGEFLGIWDLWFQILGRVKVLDGSRIQFWIDIMVTGGCWVQVVGVLLRWVGELKG